MIDKYIKPSIFVQKCTRESSFASTEYVHRFVLVGVPNGTAVLETGVKSAWNQVHPWSVNTLLAKTNIKTPIFGKRELFAQCSDIKLGEFMVRGQ
jgi:hypothetical protein